MSSEEEFKRSLNDLLDSKEFPFDEKEWGKAREIIDAGKGKNRRGIIFLSAGLLLLVGGALLYFNPGAENILPQKITAVNVPAVKTPAEPVATRNNNTAEAPRNSENSNIAANANKPVVGSKPAAAEKINPEPIKERAVAVAPAKEPLTRTAEPSEDPRVTEPAQGSKPQVKPKNSEPTVASNHPNAPASVLIEPVAVVTAKPVSAQGAGKQTEIQAAAENKGADNNSKTPVGNDQVNESSQVQDERPILAISGENKIQMVEMPEVPLNSLNPVTINKAETPAETVSPQEKAQDPTAQPASIAKPDTSAAAAPAINENETLSRGLFIEAGATYLAGWRNPAGRDARGIDPVFGINYINYLTPHLAFSFGGQYNSVSHLSNSQYVQKVTRYRLGEESDVTIFTPVKLHYITIPLRASYSLDQKNMIGFGYNISYLLNVDCKIEKYHEAVGGSEGITTKGEPTFSTGSGYTEGMKWYDSQVSVFYRRKLWKELSVNAEFFYGLSDIKDNTFFNSNTKERNSGLKLTLMYGFMHK